MDRGIDDEDKDDGGYNAVSLEDQVSWLPEV